MVTMGTDLGWSVRRPGRESGIRLNVREREAEASPVYDRELVRRLWLFIRPHRAVLLGAVALLPLGAALQLAPPYLLKIAIDTAIVPQRAGRVAPLAALLVGVLIAQQLVSLAQAWLLQLCGQRAMHDLRVTVHAHIIALRASYFDRTPIGRIMTRVTNDVESIAEAFASGLIAVVADAIKLIGIIVVLLYLNWRLALLTFSVLPPLLLFVGVFQRLLRRAYRLIRARLALINATLQEQLNGMRVIQIFGKEAHAERTFGEANEHYRDAYKSSIRYDAVLYAVVELLGSVTVALLLWYGGVKVLVGGVTFGLLVAFIEYVQRFFEPIRDISAKYATMQQAMAACERVFSLLDVDEPDAPRFGLRSMLEVEARPGPGSSKSAAAPAVAFRDVSFRYVEDTPLFERLSFSVAAGDSVAIVGPTGAGKSSIARLLNRLYEPQTGAIELHGVNIRAIDVSELRRRVVVLSQDVLLFAGTIRDNISLHEPSIDHDKIEQTARRLGLSQLVSLEKQVLERGSNLSLGERQLVVFARALVRDPELLVLDEATASVDPESEQIVQEGIRELMRERTAIVIAHRLTTIERVDRVLVLDRGQIVEEGSHAQLISAAGHYARLYRLQYV